MFIPLNSITVDERIREDKKGSEETWREFKNSFAQRGQLQPIKVARINPMPGGPDGNINVIAPSYKLIAGERRLLAISELNAIGETIPGLPVGYIEASERDETPLRVRLMMEFDENEKRKDFDFVEKARFIRRFHESMIADAGSQWTQELTASALSLSPASISSYLRVEEAVKESESVAKAATLDAAIKRMRVEEKLAARHEAAKLGDNNAFQRAQDILKLGDARVLVKELADASIDLINFDPPWGEDVAHKSQENHEEFDDSSEYSNQLMTDLFPELFRVLKNDRFIIFWHRSWASESIGKWIEQFGFNHGPTRTPCVWYKPDKTTDQNRIPEKQLIEAYEMFFLLRKGDPIFYDRFVNNVFAFDRIGKAAVIHPTEKPLALCEALVKLCSVPGELVLDPTSGSSAFLESAARTSRRARGFELSPRYYERGISRLAEYLKTFSEV